MTDYSNLCGVDLLKAFYRDHGIMEEELELCERWGFWVDNRLVADEHGLSYLKERVENIKNYRNMTVDDVLDNMDKAPWSWPSAMHFEKIYGVPPRSNADIRGILRCDYKGKRFLFGIGKEEAVITPDMSENGDWASYTFAD